MTLYIVCNYTQASPHPCSGSVKDPWEAASPAFPRQEHSRRHGSGVTLSHARPGGQDTPARGTGSSHCPCPASQRWDRAIPGAVEPFLWTPAGKGDFQPQGGIGWKR